ncbi:MAG: transketolase [Rhodospirillales bacterium]|nr:MAG: transketolase [Rhodospirillales bacterium]
MTFAPGKAAVGSALPAALSEESEATHKEMVDAIRMLAADAVEKAKSGHPGLPMGMANVAAVLWTRFLKFDPSATEWEDRDRFILSAGHGSMLLYALLYLTGYEDVTIDEIRNFRQLNSKTPGHPEYGVTRGVETTTGPLAQGLGNAVGMALAERLRNARWGDEVVDHFTYCIVGDGCLMEGLSQEAISLAGFLRLARLIVLWDDNRISIDGPTSLTTGENHLARFEACGWDAVTVDGEDAEAVAAAIAKAKLSDKPSLIACRTTIGMGAPNKGGTAATHGAPLGSDEVNATRRNLGWPYPPFMVPPHILNAWRRAGQRSVPEREAWESRFAAMAEDKRAEFLRTSRGRLAPGWQTPLNEFKQKLAKDQPTWATRKASGQALEILTASFPELIGGSADLSESVFTQTSHTADIGPGDYTGRYIHYGVREHAMAAIMNGMALHGGFIPYGGTFLVFADYMRGAMRMSALMKQRVIYVLTHDSIGVGEDGPTHHPSETLAGLRVMPNLLVFRPADAVETFECWVVALTEYDMPSCLALTRQAVPAVRKEHESVNLSARGAYVLEEAECGEREVTLFATGSEVHVAVKARERLEAEGIATAVVSMPCWKLFDLQSERYRREVMGPDWPYCVRIAVEAAISPGWDRYIGENGIFIGLKDFSLSAPGPVLFDYFGITPDNVVANAREAVARRRVTCRRPAQRIGIDVVG